MKRTGSRSVVAVRVTTLFLAAAVSFSLQAEYEVDTFVVRASPSSEAEPQKQPEVLLGKVDVGERFCHALHCVVLAESIGQRRQLEALASQGLISLEPLADAHQVLFRDSTYDARSGGFETDFPGRADFSAPGDFGLYVAIFKAFPEESWIRAIADSGLTPLEPLRTMAYYVYGPRKIADSLRERFPFLYALLEVPAGLKRANLDTRSAGDTDDPLPTTVVLVASRHDLILPALLSAGSETPHPIYATGPLEAYTVPLSRSDALALSLLPEVFSVTRLIHVASPSDERSNRLIAGVFQSPGSSWTSTLPSNSSTPHFWDNYRSQLTSIGLDLSNQTIGFLDTGVDSGLRHASADYCPPFLRLPGNPPGPCRLVFTSDTTETSAETKADDLYYHGTLVTSLAAGFASSPSDGRDSGNTQYAFTQGVAQNAKVAVCQFFEKCGRFFRAEGEAQPFSNAAVERRMRYALIELGSTASLPDGGIGPGAKIINHSWNIEAVNTYTENALLLDRTARTLSTASFTFGNGQTITGPTGPNSGLLHVVSAGNGTGTVSDPAPAKNVITVGATETYNQQSYTPGCAANNLDNADNALQIAGFSKTGFPYQRLKPDLVAPGTRSYGPRSAVFDAQCSTGSTDCNMNLDGSGRYGWNWGTSFSAPVVSGAAAIVRDWFRVMNTPQPSPALLKAALIATAHSISTLPACASGCTPCCSYCGDVRPAPDKYQGWGGVSLDRFFRAQTNYFYYDQATTFVSLSDQPFERTLTIADTTKDVNIALVWTDRPGKVTEAPFGNLVNDLDMSAAISSGGLFSWYGNNFYSSVESCQRNGYSLRNPTLVVPDHKNNVEKISIKATDIPAGATQITIRITPISLTGDGIDPTQNTTFRQDFALFVENARQ